MDYEKLGYTVIKMKYGDVGKYNIKNNIFITDITPSLSAFQDVNVNTRGMGIMHTHGFYNISWIEKGGFYYNVDLKRVYVRDKTLIMFLLVNYIVLPIQNKFLESLSISQMNIFAV